MSTPIHQSASQPASQPVCQFSLSVYLLDMSIRWLFGTYRRWLLGMHGAKSMVNGRYLWGRCDWIVVSRLETRGGAYRRGEVGGNGRGIGG